MARSGRLVSIPWNNDGYLYRRGSNVHVTRQRDPTRVIRVSTPPKGADDGDLPRSDRRELFMASITKRADDVRTCTISPLPRSERMLHAEWIAALEGSFVSLDEMR